MLNKHELLNRIINNPKKYLVSNEVEDILSFINGYHYFSYSLNKNVPINEKFILFEKKYHEELIKEVGYGEAINWINLHFFLYDEDAINRLKDLFLKNNLYENNVNNAKLLDDCETQKIIAIKDKLYLDMILSLKDKPGMYLPRKSLKLLKRFMDGFSQAFEDETGEKMEMPKDLYDFIKKRNQVKITKSWEKYYYIYCPDESYSYDNFYKTFNDYLNKIK